MDVSLVVSYPKPIGELPDSLDNLGVYQNGSITGANLYDMCGIFLEFHGNTPWEIFDVASDGTTGNALPNDQNAIKEGQYLILSIGILTPCFSCYTEITSC